jgi:isopenicillin N synthase-like dioxygenase
MNIIPEISFQALKNENKEALTLLSDALHEHGFFSLTEHNLSESLVKSCYNSSKKFFDLDMQVKLRYHDKLLKGARGYTPNGIETAVGETTPDQKEFWHHGPVIDETYDSRIINNLLIREVDDFNDNYNQLFNNLNDIGLKILRSISLTLNIEQNFFDSWVLKGNSLLRSIHYPPVKKLTNQYRARAHEDINLITLLIGAEEGGLEILNKNNQWIKVTPSSKAIVCNIGDMMQLVTDNKLKSTTHRVMNYSNADSKSRYSIPFFMHPSPDTILKSVFNDEDKGILAHDFLDERLKAIKLY